MLPHTSWASGTLTTSTANNCQIPTLWHYRGMFSKEIHSPCFLHPSPLPNYLITCLLFSYAALLPWYQSAQLDHPDQFEIGFLFSLGKKKRKKIISPSFLPHSSRFASKRLFCAPPPNTPSLFRFISSPLDHLWPHFLSCQILQPQITHAPPFLCQLTHRCHCTCVLWPRWASWGLLTPVEPTHRHAHTHTTKHRLCSN